MPARSVFRLLLWGVSLVVIGACASARESAKANDAAAEEMAASEMFGESARFAPSTSLWVDALAENTFRLPFDDDRASPSFVAQSQGAPTDAVRPREFLNLLKTRRPAPALVLHGDHLVATFTAPEAGEPLVVARDVDVERALRTTGPVALEASRNLAPLPETWLDAARQRRAPSFLIARGEHDDRTLKALADVAGARYLYGDDAPELVRVAATELELVLELRSGFVRADVTRDTSARARGGFLLDGEVATWVIPVVRSPDAASARAQFRYLDKDGVPATHEVELIVGERDDPAVEAWQAAVKRRGAL